MQIVEFLDSGIFLSRVITMEFILLISKLYSNVLLYISLDTYVFQNKLLALFLGNNGVII